MTSSVMSDSDRLRLNVGITKLRKVHIYANIEQLGAATLTGSEDSTVM